MCAHANFTSNIHDNEAVADYFNYDENYNVIDGGYFYSESISEDLLELIPFESQYFLEKEFKTIDYAKVKITGTNLVKFSEDFFPFWHYFRSGDILYALK